MLFRTPEQMRSLTKLLCALAIERAQDRCDNIAFMWERVQNAVNEADIIDWKNLTELECIVTEHGDGRITFDIDKVAIRLMTRIAGTTARRKIKFAIMRALLYERMFRVGLDPDRLSKMIPGLHKWDLMSTESKSLLSETTVLDEIDRAQAKARFDEKKSTLLAIDHPSFDGMLPSVRITRTESIFQSIIDVQTVKKPWWLCLMLIYLWRGARFRCKIRFFAPKSMDMRHDRSQLPLRRKQLRDIDESLKL